MHRYFFSTLLSPEVILIMICDSNISSPSADFLTLWCIHARKQCKLRFHITHISYSEKVQNSVSNSRNRRTPLPPGIFFLLKTFPNFPGSLLVCIVSCFRVTSRQTVSHGGRLLSIRKCYFSILEKQSTINLCQNAKGGKKSELCQETLIRQYCHK